MLCAPKGRDATSSARAHRHAAGTYRPEGPIGQTRSLLISCLKGAGFSHAQYLTSKRPVLFPKARIAGGFNGAPPKPQDSVDFCLPNGKPLAKSGQAFAHIAVDRRHRQRKSAPNLADPTNRKRRAKPRAPSFCNLPRTRSGASPSEVPDQARVIAQLSSAPRP